MARERVALRVDVLFLVCGLLTRAAMPSVIQDHRENQHQKDLTNNVNGQAFNQENHRADKANENQNALIENKSNQFIGAKDSGQYVNQDTNKKLFDDNKSYGGHTFNHDSGEKQQGAAAKKAHKKGHHNTGFHNSYHKDESSNNSSYFDDYSDEADQSNMFNNRGRYGNEAGKQYNGRKEDGILHVDDNSKRGNYDRHGGTDARNADHRDYDRKRYHDDRRDLAQHQRAQNYNARDHELAQGHVVPPYHGVPGQYDRPSIYRPRMVPNYRREYYDEARPVPVLAAQDFRRRDFVEDPAHQTITIFEDPRMPENFRDDSLHREQSDFVRLDVRPGGQRYQRFDSYYEHEPRRGWGVNRRSEINPLVFNYNRY